MGALPRLAALSPFCLAANGLCRVFLLIYLVLFGGFMNKILLLSFFVFVGNPVTPLDLLAGGATENCIQTKAAQKFESVNS